MISRLAARFAAWMRARFPGGPQSSATDGGYWGGITMWDRTKALLSRRRD